MCGILAAFNTKIKNQVTPFVNDFIINQYEDQYDRGTKGFGIIRIDKKRKIEIDRATEPVKFLLDLYLKQSSMIIAHHRTPTSTSNLIGQTHPISISDKQLEFDYEVIHNGIISNTDELYKKHKELGFIYTTEISEYGYENSIRTKWNDSESIAIELALYIEKKITAIGIDNNAAFIILQKDKNTQKGTRVFFGRNGTYSELNVYQTDNELRISSEGIGEETKEGELYSFKLKDKKMKLSTRTMEFKKKEIPALPGRTEKSIIESNTQIINKQLDLVKTEETLRAWTDAEEMDPSTDVLVQTEIGKNYIEEAKANITEKIKTEDTNAITHIIDDSLDAEIEKIAEILSEYKACLQYKRFDDREIFYYSSQIFRITKAMKEMTDIADKDYEEKLELEEDLETYNNNYSKDGWEGRTYETRSHKPMGFEGEY